MSTLELYSRTGWICLETADTTSLPHMYVDSFIVIYYIAYLCSQESLLQHYYIVAYDCQ